ncbi:MAG: hypothetical protein KatS3mg094_332 [Candidatus Parcubacteria bacterium]|nr:MAG: hypothetical protein KatS3mg094_332 [Candidatus Parcubacteria bacterium]
MNMSMQFLGGKNGIVIFLNKMKFGRFAENLVCKFLEIKNFKIIKRNWWLKKYGEIDIIAYKNNCYYFIEVKALKNNINFDPSVNYNKLKKERFHNLINYYVNKYHLDKFTAGLITVQKINKKIKIKFFKNV